LFTEDFNIPVNKILLKSYKTFSTESVLETFEEILNTLKLTNLFLNTQYLNLNLLHNN
jgi:hypothetical protein